MTPLMVLGLVFCFSLAAFLIYRNGRESRQMELRKMDHEYYTKMLAGEQWVREIERLDRLEIEVDNLKRRVRARPNGVRR